MIPSWVEENRYTDVPFLNRGCDLNGWDCYHLVKYINEKHYNKILPEVKTYVNANDPRDVSNTIREQVKVWKAIDLNEAKSGDVILFKFSAEPTHCGLILDDTWMLHVMNNCMTALEKYKKFPWNQRYDSAYTYID